MYIFMEHGCDMIKKHQQNSFEKGRSGKDNKLTNNINIKIGDYAICIYAFIMFLPLSIIGDYCY